jgi:hypothetical protein
LYPLQHAALIDCQPERLALLVAADDAVNELNGRMVGLDWRFIASLRGILLLVSSGAHSLSKHHSVRVILSRVRQNG